MKINGNLFSLKKDFFWSSLSHCSCELVFILRFCNCCCCCSLVLLLVIRLKVSCSASCLLIGVFVKNVFTMTKSMILSTTLHALQSIAVFWSVSRSQTIETEFSKFFISSRSFTESFMIFLLLNMFCVSLQHSHFFPRKSPNVCSSIVNSRSLEFFSLQFHLALFPWVLVRDPLRKVWALHMSEVPCPLRIPLIVFLSLWAASHWSSRQKNVFFVDWFSQILQR